MPTPNNPILVSSLLRDMLMFKDFNPNVKDFNYAWIREWKKLMGADLLFGKSMATSNVDGEFRTVLKNEQQIKTKIKTSAAGVGNTWVLTFYDAAYENFTVGDKVTDGKDNEGQVISQAAGTVTLIPLLKPAAFTGAEFIVDDIIYGRGRIVSNLNSAGADKTIYDEKTVQLDYSEITRASYQVARREKTNLWGLTMNGEQKFYGWSDTEADVINTFCKNNIYKLIFGVGGKNVQLQDGRGSKTWGITDRIINSNPGGYVASNQPITQSIFEGLAMDSANAFPSFAQDNIILPGRRALRQIASFYPTQLGFAGGKRKDDGTMSISLDVREVIVAGMTLNVAFDFSFLNDTQAAGGSLPDFHQDSVYFLNKSMLTIEGRTQSMIQPIHFSQDPNSTSGMIYKIIPGMTDNRMTESTIGMFQLGGGGGTESCSSIDGYSGEVECDSGCAMLARGQMLFQKTS